MDIDLNLYSAFRKHLSAESGREWIYWKSDGTFPVIPYHIRSDSAALFTCESGCMELEINMKTYHFSVGDVVVLLPEHILYIRKISPDYKGCGLLFSRALWKEARRDVEKMNPYYAMVKELPCVSISPGQSSHLSYYMNIFKDMYGDWQTVYNRVIVRKLLTVLLYEINLLYIGVIEKLPEPGKKETIFQEFLKLVAIHFKQQRGIKFYAAAFQMTPRYFSSVIKECSEQSAAEWIDNYVVAEAGILLRTTTLSVKEVSDRLNFPNQSFFGKYFKRHTGVSPKQYRTI